jgi:hypothetical protein
VLRKPWVAPDLIKPPKGQRLPDILTVAEIVKVVVAWVVKSQAAFLVSVFSSFGSLTLAAV